MEEEEWACPWFKEWTEEEKHQNMQDYWEEVCV
jgi:hypothetical protein